ncbi:hypothetical protein EBS_1841 [endosymbiont of unidentified scaly snail isolate Monju]|nr:hypothetical protein EBS_1841 [endosymbiont of unidentified scaly snail isolate Monju]
MGLLGKILLTVIVIAGALLVLRARAQARLPRVSPPVGPSAPRSALPIGWLASAVVVLMLGVAAFWLYSSWRESWREAHDVLYVRVVDAGTGHVTHYRAYRGDIDDREFITTDGVRVRLADTERLETSTIPPARN